jgi:hypothetical protein
MQALLYCCSGASFSVPNVRSSQTSHEEGTKHDNEEKATVALHLCLLPDEGNQKSGLRRHARELASSPGLIASTMCHDALVAESFTSSISSQYWKASPSYPCYGSSHRNIRCTGGPEAHWACRDCLLSLVFSYIETSCLD